MKVDRLSVQHRRVGLDSNLFIYLFEGTGREAALVGELLDAISAGAMTGVLATLGVAEILTGPVRAGDTALAERYGDELASVTGLDLVPLSAKIAADAATLRGLRRASLADAVHLATARAAGATAFITNDRALRSSPHLEVVRLT
ncbi:MAG TPA: PIN domain-containing protein [Candidatus Limnocylindria bacterium]|nr:PIN domain-containing protein [Candidatus Limnocylindria bacterium]